MTERESVGKVRVDCNKWQVTTEEEVKTFRGILVTVSFFFGGVGGARGVMVIVVGNEHGDTSSNPGRDWLHFT